MAEYTTQLRSICEFYAGETSSQGYDKVDEIVQKSAPKIFDNFEIFDEEYRIPLETKILRHFYTREICMETVGLWKLHFNNKMREVMRYYNKLYESELIKFNPLYDTDLTREHNRTNDSEVNNESSSNNGLDRTNDGTQNSTYNSDDTRNLTESTLRLQETKNKDTRNLSSKQTPSNWTTTYTPHNLQSHEKNKFMDTPQSNAGIIDDGYLTDYRDIVKTETGYSTNEQSGTFTTADTGTLQTDFTNDDNQTRNVSDVNKEENSRFNKYENNTSETGYNNSNSNTTTNNIEDFFEKTVGKQSGKSYSKMLQEFRDTFLNIDMMIIKDLEPLFFGLW